MLLGITFAFTLAAATCSSSKLGNGVCDPECLSSNYNYDMPDCENMPFCAPRCPLNLQYDLKCDSECDTPACNYDNYNCLCSPGCFPNMIGDNVCNPECNKAACNSDAGDCNGCKPQSCANGGTCTVDLYNQPVCDCPVGTCDPTCRSVAKPLGTVRATGSFCGQMWDNCNATYFGNSLAQFCCKNASGVYGYDCSLSKPTAPFGATVGGAGTPAAGTVKRVF